MTTSSEAFIAKAKFSHVNLCERYVSGRSTVNPPPFAEFLENRRRHAAWLAERDAERAALWADAVDMPASLEDLASGKMTRD